MIDLNAVILAGVGLFFLFLLLLIFSKKKSFPYYSRQTLLSQGELKFYAVLKACVDHEFDISCKVRLADIVNCSSADWRKGHGPKISSKHIDFVLTDPDTSKIILCIELDDKTHQLPKRQKRDIFVNKVLEKTNIPLYRITAMSSYDMSRIMHDIRLNIK